MHNRILFFLCFIGVLVGCSPKAMVEVTNPLPEPRADEMVEIALASLPNVRKSGASLVVRSADGTFVPSQITHDSLLIFPVSLAANGKAIYTVSIGKSDSMSTVACGRYYPERLDDIAWENDRAAYRAYGPAQQATGGKIYGYDIFTKSVPYPVVAYRYALHHDKASWHAIDSLRKAGCNGTADSLFNTISYHVDHGNGMDTYTVGATLGGGTAALMLADSSIAYPNCYKSYEFLDNGPLRFTVRLVFGAERVGSDSAVVETRTISLDKGSYFNKTSIRYDALSEPRPVAAGIAIHPQNPSGYWADKDGKYIAYADSTDNSRNGNGVIYIGAIFPECKAEVRLQKFSAEQQNQRGAIGHLLGICTYQPNSEYTYYWGSGWSKCGFEDPQKWTDCLSRTSLRLSNPLKVVVR